MAHALRYSSVMRSASSALVLIVWFVGCASPSVPPETIVDATPRADVSAPRDVGETDAGVSPLDAADTTPDALADVGVAVDADAAPAPDARVEPEDAASAPDALMQPEDAASASDALVTPEDGGAVPDAAVPPPDAGPAGCTFPPVAVDGPFPPGPPPASAHLLLTDTSSNTIFRVSLTGSVLQQWPSPVARVYGVAHDRRTPDGFWIAGYPIVGNVGANRPFRRLSFAGVVTADLAYASFSTDGFHGTDFALGPTPADDVLVFAMNNRNNVDTISGALTRDGARWFEGGRLDPATRWYGVHVERYACADGNSLVYWTTRASALVLREWPVAAELRTYPLPTTTPRGVARTPYGDFYVVDGGQRRVLHLDASGVLLGSFATPGPNPGDVSYGE